MDGESQTFGYLAIGEPLDPLQGHDFAAAGGQLADCLAQNLNLLRAADLLCNVASFS